jgi:ferrous iron transport protein B
MGTDWANDTFGGGIQEWAGAALAAAGASDFIQSLVVDGILGGLFAVFGFLPQMALLFLMLSILEDCGYMVRIAFVMDRVFRHFGLSGKSFIPLLIASGCGIPGIMASKTIENDNDRRLTIMTATFIPCGAKLPVIAALST